MQRFKKNKKQITSFLPNKGGKNSSGMTLIVTPCCSDPPSGLQRPENSCYLTCDALLSLLLLFITDCSSRANVIFSYCSNPVPVFRRRFYLHALWLIQCCYITKTFFFFSFCTSRSSRCKVGEHRWRWLVQSGLDVQKPRLHICSKIQSKLLRAASSQRY